MNNRSDLSLPVRVLGEPYPLPSPLCNMLSFDVEDWYQVSDFEEAVDFGAWDSYESRVVRNTERVLELCDARGVKGTFFILTWNAERHPEPEPIQLFAHFPPALGVPWDH